jgi:ATP-dependent RNA helicase RhlE
MGVSRRTVEALAMKSILKPTPIQSGAIPPAMDGRDVIGLAQTGTGKTVAFGVPIVERLESGQVALVLAPTRELAHQISDSLAILGLRTVLVVGGESMSRQVGQLRKPHDLVVATPGRLMDHLGQRTYQLRRIRIAVLDEADRMLDMGFAPDIKKILDQCPRPRQTLLFSATMPDSIEELAMEFLNDPVRIEVAPQGTASELVDQSVWWLKHDEKPEALKQLLDTVPGSVLVFARTRHGARKLARNVNDMGVMAAEIHADRTLAQRRAALAGFKEGLYRVLVATDIAARGIDVKGISLVVNWDLPENAEDYVHRIGRTGRAGMKGLAVSLALHGQKRLVRSIERLMSTRLEDYRPGTVMRKPDWIKREEESAPVERKKTRPLTVVGQKVRTHELPRLDRGPEDFLNPRGEVVVRDEVSSEKRGHRKGGAPQSAAAKKGRHRINGKKKGRPEWVGNGVKVKGRKRRK